MKTTSVLVVDDDRDLAELLTLGLRQRGLEADAVHSGREALDALEQSPRQVVLTDLDMPQMGGIELSEAIGKRFDIPVIVLTGNADLDSALGAIRTGVYDYLLKPASLDTLMIAIERACRHRTLSDEVRRLRELSLGGEAQDRAIIGDSRAMRAVDDLVRRVAGADVSVLVTGESGTGKELVARQLHRLSPRSEARFIAVNCAALPANLLESELFGHVDGAFTGARAAKEGLFVAASGGTLFLDEIGDMPMEMQAKLLRALQEGHVRPVGSVEEVPFDARVVAATNRDLEDDLEEGRFREDLYYRINVVHVSVPPLRARGQDILLLAQHFVRHCAKDMGRDVKGLAASVAERLLQHDWPGNVRELENAMQRAVALARYDEVTLDDLPDRLRAPAEPRPLPAVVTSGDPEQLPSLESLERKHILAVVQAVDGNKSRAARILGVDRRTLYRKAERYGLEL